MTKAKRSIVIKANAEWVDVDFTLEDTQELIDVVAQATAIALLEFRDMTLSKATERFSTALGLSLKEFEAEIKAKAN